jgi:hypothetical protein
MEKCVTYPVAFEIVAYFDSVLNAYTVGTKKDKPN